jgi:hypothetical protein
MVHLFLKPTPLLVVEGPKVISLRSLRIAGVPRARLRYETFLASRDLYDFIR